MVKRSNNSHKSPLTYVSLFSSAGVGCFGFKENGFHCIATNEIIDRRLNVQRINKKCKYDSGYILGDITSTDVQKSILDEVDLWKKTENVSDVDVLIATPPCQGISVANHKKNNELGRNSLVVESVKMIMDIRPKFFVMENVASFLKTICTDLDNDEKTIQEMIFSNLGPHYSIYHRVVNLKRFVANSSRTRTIIVGVRNDVSNYISPIEIFPNFQKERSIRESIGDLNILNTMGQIDDADFFHSFRAYPEHMSEWIKDLKEGQSAFDNTDTSKIPHRIVNGEIIYNQNKNSGKYTRQAWDKIAPCIHTRNDQLASQNTIHPRDDRVFSIRELMRFMTIPDSFKWVDFTTVELNNMTYLEKKAIYKKHEMNIRRSIGEAVPTAVFSSIAKNIINVTSKVFLTDSDIRTYIIKNQLGIEENLLRVIKYNPDNLGLSTLAKIAEYANPSRQENAAFFTDKSTATRIINELPDLGDGSRILEPSVGVGNFIELIMKNYQHLERLTIDVVDIDNYAVKIFKELLKNIVKIKGVTINIITDDFLLHDFSYRYDLIIGNPPFGKIKVDKRDLLLKYKSKSINKETNNIFAFFLERALTLGDKVSLIMPKAILNAPEFETTRNILENKKILAIIDYGEKGFSKVLIETIAMIISTKPSRNNKTVIISVPKNIFALKKQSYICDSNFPYWLIYRDKYFDEVASDLTFSIFNVYRDRQITNKYLKDSGEIRVLRSRNISDDGREIIDIAGYDKYLDTSQKDIDAYVISKYMYSDDIYLAPNMTYKPRMSRKPKGMIVNGSIAILIPKNNDLVMSNDDLLYYSSDEYRRFYNISRNYQTRSLNIDSRSVFFFGKKKESS